MKSKQYSLHLYNVGRRCEIYLPTTTRPNHLTSRTGYNIVTPDVNNRHSEYTTVKSVKASITERKFSTTMLHALISKRRYDRTTSIKTANHSENKTDATNNIRSNNVNTYYKATTYGDIDRQSKTKVTISNNMTSYSKYDQATLGVKANRPEYETTTSDDTTSEVDYTITTSYDKNIQLIYKSIISNGTTSEAEYKTTTSDNTASHSKYDKTTLDYKTSEREYRNTIPRTASESEYHIQTTDGTYPNNRWYN